MTQLQEDTGSRDLEASRHFTSPNPTPVSAHAEKQMPEDETPKLSKKFKVFVLTMYFIFSANFTVILPTSHNYVASMGAGGWFAGMVVAASLGPGVLTVPLASYFFKKSYKPALFLFLASNVLGNVLYGLGPTSNNLWIILCGQVLRGLLWGGCGRVLPQHVSYEIIRHSERSAWMATVGNVTFFGLGMGPMFGAALSKLSFNIGCLRMNEFTNPGWFFGILWLLLLVALVFTPEPPRPFAALPTLQKEEQASKSTCLNGKILWSISTTTLMGATIAVWETSAAVVSQKYFAWSSVASSIFIGLEFLGSSFGGEAVKALMRKREIREADLIAACLGTVLISSALLYWYMPSTESCLGNEIAYVLGSFLVMTAANVCRNYSNALSLRAAASVSNETKDWVTQAIAVTMTLGRSLGAIYGMSVVGMQGGANFAAGLMTGMSFCMLAFLLVPELFAGLRKV